MYKSIVTMIKVVTLVNTSINVYDRYKTIRYKHSSKIKNPNYFYNTLDTFSGCCDVDVIYKYLEKANNYNKYKCPTKRIKVIFVNQPKNKRYCLDYCGHSYVQLEK